MAVSEPGPNPAATVKRRRRPVVPRECGTCKFFQASPVRNLGWCLNPKMEGPRDRTYVNKHELSCDRTFYDYWEQRTDFLGIPGLSLPRVSPVTASLVGGGAAALTLVLCIGVLSLNAFANRGGPSPVASVYPGPGNQRVVATVTATAGPTRLKIANTDGLGAYIRPEPSLKAAGTAAWTDGTILEVVGADRTIEGKPWKNVKDPRGNVGWILAEYLVPAE